MKTFIAFIQHYDPQGTCDDNHLKAIVTRHGQKVTIHAGKTMIDLDMFDSIESLREKILELE